MNTEITIKDLSCLETLRKSVLQSRKLKLLYVTSSLGRNDTNERTVNPYGLVVKYSEWYLVGFCESRNSIRTFKCDRIINAEIMPDYFIIPEDFSLSYYWYDNTKKFKNKFVSNPE